jgi:hypothetical protein
MVDYLVDWMHNILVTLAAVAGVGLLAYAGLRQFYPGTMATLQQGLNAASSWISGIELWPVVTLVALFAVVTFTLPQHRDRI